MKRSFALLIVALMAVSGCAALNKLLSSFKKPTLVFRDAQLADASLSGITLNLNYSLQNPNPIGLNIATVSYQLLVDGHSVVSGSPPSGMKIKAKGDTPLSFPANVQFASIAPVLETFLTKDSAHYQAKGTVGIKTPIGIITLPLDVQGDFEVPKVPAVALEAPRVSQLNLTGATLELPVTFTNRNTYPLPIQALAGALRIGGAHVGNLTATDVGALPGKGQQRVSIPISINFAQAASAAQALRSGRGQFSLAGALTSGAAQIPVSLNQTLRVQR